MPAEKYPEHVKLGAIKDKSQTVYDFLEWAGEKGMHLGEWEPTQRRTANGQFGRNRIVPHMHPVQTSKRDLLAEFFDIDLNKIEKEMRAMLDEMRAMNEATKEEP